MKLEGLELLLGVHSPWYIKETIIQKENNVLDVYIDYENGSKFSCPNCGKPCTVYDGSYSRIRHLDLFEYRCYLNIKVPRINCDRDGVKTTHADQWSRKGSHYSFRFEALIIRLCREMSVSAISRECGEPDNNLWRTFHSYVKTVVTDSFDFRSIRRVCVDETAIKRGHNYVSIFTDYDTGNVLFVADGRKKEVFDLFYGWLWDKGGFPGDIELFSMDMSTSYKAGRQAFFAHSEVVYDRFHIKKGLNEAINKIRVEEVKETESLKKTKYIWLKNERNLTRSQQEQLREFLYQSSTKTAQAYLLKNSFDQLWSVQQKAIEPLMNEWIMAASSLVLKPLNRFINTLTEHYNGIVMSIKTGITNAISEGLNSVMQLARSRARGYRNPKNFIAMVYFLGNYQKG
jgi:transposase